MNEHPVSRILNAIQIVTGHAPKRNGSGYLARCPAHDDHKPSLSITEGSDGRVLVKCFAGCPTESVLVALGLTMRDLMPNNRYDNDRNRRYKPQSGISSVSSPQVFATANDALSALEKKLGPRSACWTYHNTDGDPVGIVARWDRDGGKGIRPISRAPDGWIIGAMPEPRPLYRLQDVAKANRVVVVEGEKCCDAAVKIGLVATTSAGGSQAANKSDWTPLAGKTVYLMPDKDDAGKAYADAVCEQLARLSPRPTVRVVELPNLPAKGDVVDFIEWRRSEGATDDAIRDRIIALTDAAEPVGLAELVPNARAIPLYESFPTDALPEPIRTFVRQGAKALKCDCSFIALPMLAALASAIGNSRRFRLTRKWIEPAIVWGVIIGESGTRKSPALDLVMQPIRDRQKTAMAKYKSALERYETDQLKYEIKLREWKNGKGKGEPPAKPIAPIPVRSWCDDTTIEALAVLLQNQPRGLLLIRDELAGWLLSFNQYKGNRGSDSAKWLEMFGGRSTSFDRKSAAQPFVYVHLASVCIAGGIQPGALRKALGTEHRENGLAARLLMCMPPRTPKQWAEAEIPVSVEAAVTAIFDRLFTLEPEYESDGSLRPILVGMDDDAKTLMKEFVNTHGIEQLQHIDNLAAAWSKLECYVPRIALVVHFVRWAAGDPTLKDHSRVDAVSIQAGITIVEWSKREAIRIYAMLGESAADRDNRELVEWIRQRGGSITARDLSRYRKTRYPKVADAKKALDRLVDAGVGYWQDRPQQGRPGQPRQPVFKLYDDNDNNSADNPMSGNNVGVVPVVDTEDEADVGEI